VVGIPQSRSVLEIVNDEPVLERADLILWRHAEAADGEPDFSRELTRRGRRQAAKAARWLSKRLPSDARILVSPAARAQQTALAFSEDFDTDERLSVGADAPTVLAAIDYPPLSRVSVIVGHQPTLGLVASYLLLGAPVDWPIPKGGIVWLRQHANEKRPRLRAALSPSLL
jgi:phosphohistidine phosphatase